MVTIKTLLDTRQLKDNLAPVKIRLTYKRKSFYVLLGIKVQPCQWNNSTSKVVSHPQQVMLNRVIQSKRLQVENIIYDLELSGKMRNLDISKLKNIILNGGDTGPDASNLFIARFMQFANKKSPRTKDIYIATYKRMLEFEPTIDSFAFEDITKDWLQRFYISMCSKSPSINARNIHLRNIRAVFNDAIDDDITTAYPFRKLKIKNTETIKRSLSVEELRQLFTLQPEEYAVQYLDMFKLIFFLIGINIIDLCNITTINNGRIEYHRAKTKKLYSIKVEPEAMEIINKYKGDKYLLSILDRYVNYKDYTHRLNNNLKKLGKVTYDKCRKIYTPMFPQLTTYWARHTWATIAASLDIPKETIAAALGHSIGNPVTSIYIKFDNRKIDDANRRVIDYVLYNKT